MSLQDIIFLPNKETVLPNAVMNVFQLVLNFLYRLVYLCSDAIYRHAFARMKQRNRCCFGGRNPSGTKKIIEQQKMICGIARCKLCNILAAAPDPSLHSGCGDISLPDLFPVSADPELLFFLFRLRSLHVTSLFAIFFLSHTYYAKKNLRLFTGDLIIFM